MPKITERNVLSLIKRKHDPLRWIFIPHCKTGPTWFVNQGELGIFDAVAIQRKYEPQIIGYEIKVAKSDFKADTKWEKYLNFCHEFSFVCPEGMIVQDELPDDIGLIYVHTAKKSGGLYLREQRSAMPRDIEWPTGMMQYILVARAVIKDRELLDNEIMEEDDEQE